MDTVRHNGTPQQDPVATDYADARARVARGVALLDEQRPGWAQEIDVQRLHMENPCGCILGQLFGHFPFGLSRLLAGSFDASVTHGFERRDFQRSAHSFESYTAASDADYRALQDAWIEAIAARVIPEALAADHEAVR